MDTNGSDFGFLLGYRWHYPPQLYNPGTPPFRVFPELRPIPAMQELELQARNTMNRLNQLKNQLSNAFNGRQPPGQRPICPGEGDPCQEAWRTIEQFANMNVMDGLHRHHLNQNAAFPNIPRENGLSMYLPPFSHKQVHRVLNDFWRPYQRGGELENQTPTSAQYDEAVRNALNAAGCTDRNVIDTIMQLMQVESEFNNYAQQLPVGRVPGT